MDGGKKSGNVFREKETGNQKGCEKRWEKRGKEKEKNQKM